MPAHITGSFARSLLLALTLVAPLNSQASLVRAGRGQRFVSVKYRFSVACPANWRVSIRNDTPIFFSFMTDEAQEFTKQLKMPKGGAVITISEVDRSERRWVSLADWAKKDSRGVSDGPPSIHQIELPKESTISRAIQSSYDTVAFAIGEHVEHRVSIFWEFHGTLFSAHLMYRTKDPKGRMFENVLSEMVRSFRPVNNQ